MALHTLLLLYLCSPLVFGWVWSPLSTVASVTVSQPNIQSTSSIVTVLPTTTILSFSTSSTSDTILSLTSSSTVAPTVSPQSSGSNSTCPQSPKTLDGIYRFQKENNKTWSEMSLCPGACELAYGNGNADLAGIGVFVSYIVLLAFSALFGPILRIASYLTCAHHCQKRNCTSTLKHNYTKTQNFIKSWDKLQRSFLDSQAFFVIPVIAASFVEASNHPPIYEISFIHALGMALCTSLLVCTLALHDRKETLWKQIFYVVFAFSLLFILPFVCPTFIGRDLWNLGKECSKNDPDEWQKLGFGIYYHFSKFKYKVATWVALGLVSLIYVVIPIFCLWKKHVTCPQQLEVRKKWDKHRQQHQKNLMILVGTGMTVFWAYHLFTIRNAMTEVSGKGDQERAWNYGQVTAVFAWVPLLLDIGTHLIGYKKWLYGDTQSSQAGVTASTSANASNSQLPKPSNHTSVTNVSYPPSIPLVVIHPATDPAAPSRPYPPPATYAPINQSNPWQNSTQLPPV